MRVPVWLGWLLLAAGFFTAGLLRQFHDRIPTAPSISPIVGSLLFAAIFFLLLVSARERSRGRVPGVGIRLGSLTPLLLILLIEKWVSLTLHPWLFHTIVGDTESDLADAQFRALAGVVLIGVCVLVSPLSRPTMRRIWDRARPARWPAAAATTVTLLAGTYLLLGTLIALLGGGLRLRFPETDRVVGWVLGGQAGLAFAEELYYRGLVMSEIERLAPRLGLRRAAGRRWFALLGSASLFGIEHFQMGPPWGESLREMVFTVSLGLLLGVLVMVSANLHFAAGIHAWINWLLLGAAPHFVDSAGQPAIPSGTYIGLTLIAAFVCVYLQQAWIRRTSYIDSDEPLGT